MPISCLEATWRGLQRQGSRLQVDEVDVMAVPGGTTGEEIPGKALKARERLLLNRRWLVAGREGRCGLAVKRRVGVGEEGSL